MTQETEREAFDIINNKLQSAKKSPVILSWDDAETIKAALSQARARVGKGEDALSHHELELQARLAFEAECADSLIDLSPATKLSANHDMPYADGETTVRWWGFRSGYDCGYNAAQAKPVEVGVLADIIQKAISNGMGSVESFKSQSVSAEKAILERFNVTEK